MPTINTSLKIQVCNNNHDNHLALVERCKDGGKTTLELLESMKDTDVGKIFHDYFPCSHKFRILTFYGGFDVVLDSGKLQSQVEATKKSIQSILDAGNVSWII